MGKNIYVCSAYGGLEENYKKAIQYGRYVIAKGHVPIIPHTMLHGIVNDKNPVQCKLALDLGQMLLKLCDEVWVFGNAKSSQGVAGELETAETAGIPIIYIKDEYSLKDDEIMLRTLIREYEFWTGRIINRAIVEDIIYYLNEGISDKLMLEIFKRQAKSHATWQYALAILRSCLNSGILTLEQFLKKGTKKPIQDSAATYDLDLFEKMLNSKP